MSDFYKKKETTIVIIQQYREYPDKYPKFKYNTCYSSTLKAYMQGTGRRFKYNTCYYSTEQWLALDDPEKNSNTTSVTVQLKVYYQAMMAVKFKYNICYYSTGKKGLCEVFAFIQTVAMRPHSVWKN